MSVKTLRQWRYEKAIGLRELARLSGVSIATLTAIEHGRSRGYPATWRKIASTLGVDPLQIAEYRRAVGLDAERDATESEGSDREA
ncbi:helix-turn-helix transcriptional regulator [Thermomicrobiaceae bacterium CFH 74404]|uniref:Helix-turn-helix transcriptional regulator n=1 Tax=Thermalbibacter longus TaxID=2951981 RepID=A0AA42BAI0_9BACT|nr:helix-turn-helix transcriptional regulator [Thermalbibacter longus]MCM8749732.1 helix-turn-helix transcriptional regulator [Thermalbibacter longus]